MVRPSQEDNPGGKLSIIGVIVCLVSGACAQLFEWPSPIMYKNFADSGAECRHRNGHWYVDGSLELSDENVLKFFIPMVDIHSTGHKICSIDLTECPPSETQDMHKFCHCASKMGNVYHLKVVQPAQVAHKNKMLHSSLPLRYNYFKYSRQWAESIGQVPDFKMGSYRGWNNGSCDLDTPFRAGAQPFTHWHVPEACANGEVIWQYPKETLTLTVTRYGKYFNFCMGPLQYGGSVEMIYDATDRKYQAMNPPKSGEKLCFTSVNGKVAVELDAGTMDTYQERFNYQIIYSG